MSQLPGHLGGHCGVTNIDTTILPYLQGRYDISSMLDVGCGLGGMQKIANDLGIEWAGIEGDFTLKENGSVIVHDFTTGPVAIDGMFDLVWSVEFLEHVEEKYICNYMPVFARARFAIVTAAKPGLYGHHHVNCKDQDYWVRVFDSFGFRYDGIETDKIKNISNMRKDFFKRHGMFFVREDHSRNRASFGIQYATQPTRCQV
jgi:cyclopropane fatty-acyl-phospholipid synthase-like methyltransferase